MEVIGTKEFSSQSPLLRISPPPPTPQSKSGWKLVCNVNIVYGYLKSENSQNNAQKPQRNCTFMNSVSGHVTTEVNGLVYTHDHWPGAAYSSVV
jgi:hypothetical protein